MPIQRIPFYRNNYQRTHIYNVTKCQPCTGWPGYSWRRNPIGTHGTGRRGATGLSTDNGQVVNSWRKGNPNEPSKGCPCSDLDNQVIINDSGADVLTAQYWADHGLHGCYTASCEKILFAGCCPNRINQKTVQNKNGIFKNEICYSSQQYLQKRCKTIRQNSNIIDLSGVYTIPYINCFPLNNDTPCNQQKFCKQITYKPRNRQFATRGAVKSSTRVRKLKYNQKQIEKQQCIRNKCSIYPKSYSTLPCYVGQRCPTAIAYNKIH